MTIAPARKTCPPITPEPVEVLIKEARRRGRRHFLVVALVVLSAVAVVAGALALESAGGPVHRARVHEPVPPASTVAIGEAPRCSSSQVRVTYDGFLGGLGSENQLFWIENVSSQVCSIAGYPHVSFLDPHNIYAPRYANEFHIQVGYAVAYDRGYGGNDLGGVVHGYSMPRALLHPRGGASSFWINGSDAQVGSPPYDCMQSATIRVVLPGSSRPTYVTGSYYFCGTVNVHPVVPGRSGAFPPKPLLLAAAH